MTHNRIRLTKPVVASRADAEKILGEICVATADLNSLKAQLDAELTAARQNYEGRIDSLEKQLQQQSGLVQQWAEATPEEFGTKKSIDLLHGRIGFRTGTPKLKTLAGWTWDRVLSVVNAPFIRETRAVDKEGLLAAHSRGDLADTDLRTVGVRVVQDESFFIEPKLEEPAGRIVA